MESTSSFESIPQPKTKKPAIESLTNPEQAKAIWPEDILANPEFLTQIAKRHELVKTFQTVSGLLPIDTTIGTALENEQVSAELATAFYNQLSEYFEQDPANARLCLYFPFEFLPANNLTVSSPELETALRRFQKTYRSAWETQLLTHEVRANFVDGDVLEPELLAGKDHPRVVKATHLIPSLIEHGVMSVPEAITYAELSNDRLLKDGVLDALTVLKDKSLLTSEDLTRLRNSSDVYLRRSSHLLALPTLDEVKAEAEARPFTTIADELKNRLTEVANLEPENSTPARTAWLRKDAREQVLASYATKLSHSIIRGETLPLPNTLTNEEVLIGVDALRQACLKNPSLYQSNQEWIDSLDNLEPSAELSDAVSKLYAHLLAAEIVSEDELDEHGVYIPKLAGPFSENLKPIEPFLGEVRQMVKKIEEDPYLSEKLYPVTLIFGSQLKGYGTKNSDADVAVFVRPGVTRSEQANLTNKLSEVFSHEKIGGKAVLFWLENIETGMAVHDWEQPKNYDGSSSWIHVLFGAAWEGNEDSIKEIHHQLLTNYFFDPHTKLEGKSTRERWFEEMERDTLQYRLLHKGFARYYPINSQVDTLHSKDIDGQAAFYDPRYRRIATSLYLSHVFLPNLKR